MVTLSQAKLARVKFRRGDPRAPYRPSSGTESEYFMAAWCENCERDKAMNGTVNRERRDENDDDWCEILGRSFRTDEPLPEWVYDQDGQPRCTEFVPLGQTIPPPRDPRTVDMFRGVPDADL